MSTVGSFITGYSLLDQSEITLRNYPYPFIKNNVYNDLYIVIPSTYEPESYAAANKIAQSLKETKSLLPKIVSTEEVPQGEHNLILVGNPCSNKLISNELNTNKCIITENGMLKLINHEMSSTLVITGNLEKAARALSNYRNYPLRGDTVVVSGTESLTLTYF